MHDYRILSSAFPFTAGEKRKKANRNGYFSCRAAIGITADRVEKIRANGAYFLVYARLVPSNPVELSVPARKEVEEEGE